MVIKGRVAKAPEIKAHSLDVLEQPDVKKAIAYLEGKVQINEQYEFTTFNSEYYDEETGVVVEQTTTYVKLSEEAHLRVISTKAKDGNEIFNVAAIYIGEKNEIPRVFTASFEKGEILYEVDRAYDAEEFEIPQEESDIEPHIAYLDCVWGGSCCTLSGKKYKWCGAGCGSGTPINSLDTCCKWHDNCYKANTSYPARCGCDRVLNACADGTGVSGSGTLIAAFIAKMAWKGC
ncbi:hypothetical protein [Priestia megaterium]|uniref:hypothetical protein n=1 Tax=Priestia megaterium TaxID=1404 RepID=UPI003008FE41